MAETLTPKSKEAPKTIASPEKQAQIIIGGTRLAMSLCSSPEQAGSIFSTLDDPTANGLAYSLSGVPDGETVKLVGLS